MSGYADRVLERKRSSTARRRAPAAGLIWVASTWSTDRITHWPHLAVIALSAVVAAVLMVIAMLVQDTLPKPVPPELAGRVIKLQQDHWRLARIHLWWRCSERQEKIPHVHMISPEGMRRIVTGPGC